MPALGSLRQEDPKFEVKLDKTVRLSQKYKKKKRLLRTGGMGEGTYKRWR
jgi:hypothetical protein